ncbi:MAG: phosphoadenosine phosphosulfate reductase [Candidatus Altiarchaeales archaeon]|nr:MAG: phosphoadenosine phosphosulfate reductase [Candidatus Altiarchaeales archaeon]RLI94906.1 MAG: phosphoadenosine phosphosulfate reductase [Candidatus Altiarchaeales archaeon]HDO82160.1 phosphoadenosine phosphosulfate reductase family protein [Candidatus Altiarchaeales archaeon]HEX54809.1 phosphoadenosine phosphosulfate reductase family protein [Candidatus Altiarchaeales archaeon]
MDKEIMEMGFEEKVEKSKDVIREAVERFKDKIAIAWTGGKDSTVVLGLTRELFNGRVPIPVLFVDTTVKFKETYDFINKLKREWNLNLVIARNEDALKKIEIAKDRERCCHLLKTEALNMAIKNNGWKAIIAAIRWDEQEARANEKYFSPRKNHIRVHPILHFTEKDIWDYIKSRNLPYHPLYDKGYRSIGCEPCTKPSVEGGSERSGRAQDKEEIMRRLRDFGYF